VGDLYLATVVINTQDMRSAVEFWCAALGYRCREVDWRPEFNILIDPDGRRPPVSLQLAADPPREPVRLHLDLYTSEQDWRRVAVWHLVAGTGWFALAVAATLVELAGGRPLAGWALGHLAVPLVAGWMLQELVGSWTHLAPSVTPGDAAQHAAQRRQLAGASRLRPITWNAGVALAWAGVATGATPVAVAGGAALGLALTISALQLLRALTLGRY